MSKKHFQKNFSGEDPLLRINVRVHMTKMGKN